MHQSANGVELIGELFAYRLIIGSDLFHHLGPGQGVPLINSRKGNALVELAVPVDLIPPLGKFLPGIPVMRNFIVRIAEPGKGFGQPALAVEFKAFLAVIGDHGTALYRTLKLEILQGKYLRLA